MTPIGRLVHLPSQDMPSDLYLMAAVVMPGTTAMTMTMHIRQPADPAAGRPVSPSGRPFPNFLTVTDDRAAPYGLSFNGMPGPEDWDGYLDVDPAPPAGLTWLDLAADGTGALAHIDLAAGSPAPEVVVESRPVSPGERLLTRVGERLLAGGDLGSWPAPAVENLGDIVTALIEVGALPPHSAVPGHLAALCECLGRPNHGIEVTVVPDVPEPWADVLGTCDGKGRPLIRPGSEPARAAPTTRTAAAAAAVALPEIDGVRFAVAGLHSGWNRNVLYVVATGLPPPGPGRPRPGGGNRPDTGFSWWMRDGAGRWHVAVSSGSDTGTSGESRLSLNILPPLGPDTAEIELVVTGRSAQARVRLPLRWCILPL